MGSSERDRVLAIRTFICLLASVCSCAACGFEGSAPLAPDSARIERLSGICLLWGAVKYFHPYLAYSEIDWDSALAMTIPRVNSAVSAGEYASAADYMLGFLKDPVTRIIREAEPPVRHSERISQKAQPYITWTTDSTAIITLTDYGQFTNFFKYSDFQNIFAEARKARAVLFDIRAFAGREHSDEWLNYLLYRSLPGLICKNVPLSTSRHLMHSGYTPQIPEVGFYYSGFVTREAVVMQAAPGNIAQKQLVFLINEGTVSCTPLLGGLQSAGAATVVMEGDIKEETGIETYLMELPDGVAAQIRTTEIVNSDGSLGFKPDILVPYSPDTSLASNPAMQAALGAARNPVRGGRQTAVPPLKKSDKLYSETPYPPLEYRLLALFRFWNVINYFYPYKNLIDRPWSGVLGEFIPKFEAAADTLQYVLRVAEMVKNIQDTHGFIKCGTLAKYYGTHLPPLEVKFTEGQTIFTYVPDSIGKSRGIAPGDALISVDGEEIGKRRERIGLTMAASTPQALEWRVDQNVLRGPEKSFATLKIRKKDGTETEIKVKRLITSMGHQRKNAVFSVLPEGFGYFDLTRLTVSQMDAAFEKIKNTKGAIFDIRGYSNGTAWDLAPRLAKKKAVAARFHRPELNGPDTSVSSVVQFSQSVEPGKKLRYDGKIVVLINEETISQAEHTCLFLEAARDVTFIGSPTNGTNGDVTTLFLPGGIIVNFTGHDVRHGDGRQLERIGIQPEVRVYPTIRGTGEGRDEVLEKGIEFLKEHSGR